MSREALVLVTAVSSAVSLLGVPLWDCTSRLAPRWSVTFLLFPRWDCGTCHSEK